MSLRALIEAKQRRTATFPLVVGDVTAAAAALNGARHNLRAHLSTATDPAPAGWEQRTAELQTELDAAAQAVEATVAHIQLHSLPPDQWDALFDDIEPDAAGDLDMSAIHAELLAASCDDEELRDVAWWRDQFADTAKWSKGDRAAISAIMLQLNVYVPGGAGKG